MRIRLSLLALAIVLVLPATAFASLADEQRQGQQLSARLEAGLEACGQLSAENFDHIGEYVMSRALGSTSVHEAMDERMTAMMGEQSETRMHQLLGQRYTGCTSGSGGTAGYSRMRSGMMGGYYGNRGWGAMMNSTDWSWMMGGAWQTMTRQAWQRLQERLLGTGASPRPAGGWSPVAIIAVTLPVVLLGAFAIFALIPRSSKRPPTADSST